MPRTPPPLLGLALTVLRLARGWTQKELFAATGLSRGVLSEYETGKTELTRGRLEWLTAVMGWRPGAVDRALAALEFLDSGPDAPRWPVDPDEDDLRIIERATAAASREVAQALRAELTREVHAAKAAQGRREAAVLWERLKLFSARERRILVAGAAEYQDPFFCELLCAESERAAAADAGVAQELAELALLAAERVSGPPALRSRAQGYAWAFVGNARRVANKLPEADAAFARFHRLWKDGAAAGPELFDEARLLDLEASLRRAQRRFPEALALHDRALAAAKPEEAGYILVNKAIVQEELEDYRGALATLQQADSLVQARREPRLAFALRFNQATNLLQLGRLGEVEPLLSEARELAVRQAHQLDLIRVVWLSARVAALKGCQEEAMAGMEQVRREFRAREMAFDYALVSLELAVLCLEKDRPGVRALARQMLWIFQAQGVHREALAALLLFHKSAEREELTPELARRLVAYLERARRDPGLRFDPSGGPEP